MLYDGILFLIKKYKQFYRWIMRPRQQKVGLIIIIILVFLVHYLVTRS